MMSVKSQLKRRESETELLEEALAANAMNMKEESGEDEVQPTASSMLSDEGSTASKKLLEARASVCSIHYRDCRDSVKKY